jgi:hypothetical protein
MGASFGSPGMRVQIAQTRRGYHCRGLSREHWVLQCLGESEGRGRRTQYPLRAGAEAEVYR